MFDGEKASLEAILQTNTIKAPKPVKVIDLSPGGGAVFVMEHLDMRSINRHSAMLGEQLADLHLHNQSLKEKLDKGEQTVDLFRDVEIIPALLHGDLWGGNVAENEAGPLVFDPASYYGHSEFELAIAGMFGGFGGSFYSAYHKKIPKAPGFEKRLKLYQLFHYLNHWNHFGTGYRGSSLNIMRNLVK
ncbi:UNVERIFIED_CONTAM: hypothetical protein FKN15_063960 [Acipenser sinensis]